MIKVVRIVYTGAFKYAAVTHQTLMADLSLFLKIGEHGVVSIAPQKRRWKRLRHHTTQQAQKIC